MTAIATPGVILPPAIQPMPSPPDRDALARLGLPLARRIAAAHGRRFPRLSDEFESAAYVGLAEAVDRFEPERGSSFSVFAGRRIYGAILDAHRTAALFHSRRRAAEIPAVHSIHDVAGTDETGNSYSYMDTLTADEDGPDTPPSLDAALDYGRFASTAVQRSVLRRIYGHAGTATRRKAGEHLGLSMSRVSQIHEDAVATIRGRLGLDNKSDRPESAVGRAQGRRGLRLESWHRDVLTRLIAAMPGATLVAVARRFEAESGTRIDAETVRRYRGRVPAEGGAA